MQLNCILFPGRSSSNITPIKVHLKTNSEQNHINSKGLDKQTCTLLTYINPRNKYTDHLSIIAGQIKEKYKESELAANQQTMLYTQNSIEQEDYSKLIKNYNNLEIKNIKQNNMSHPLRNIQQNRVENEEENEEVEAVKVNGYIPCLFIPGSEKIVIYFHGNAEDLTTTTDFVGYINQKLGFSVLAMQYPGYSVYEGNCASQKIEKDCLIMMSYLLRIGVQLKSIFVIGRSIGTGPALFLCSYYKVAGLMLISPFLSISNLIKDKYGTIPSFLVKQRFQNYKIIEYVSIPIFILHGLEDAIVPFTHASKLQQLAPGKCHIKLVQKMTHSSFDFKNDFLEPLKSFLSIIKY